MALVTSLLFQGLRGKFGKNLVFKQRRGKTYVEPMPVYNKDRVATQKELDVRAKFAVAVAYARKAMAAPEMYEVYKSKANRKKTAYGIAFRHTSKSPVVRGINTGRNTGLPGSKIFIWAVDDVRVEEVTVSIVSADGELIEHGNAYLPAENALDWIYDATQVNNELEGCRIIAVAKNLPGNEGMMEIVLCWKKFENYGIIFPLPNE